MKPLISAHRGGAKVDGQTAAQRFEQAIALGVDYVEFDVRRTKDGVAVIFHDDIPNLTYRQLKDRIGGEALTYDELLAIAGGKVGLHLDLKETGYEADVIEAALAKSPLDKLRVTGEDDVIRHVKEQFPHVTAGLSLGEELKGVGGWRRFKTRFTELVPLRRIKRCHADFVAVHWRLAEVNVLRSWARRGLDAWVWTVDEEPKIRQFLNDRRVAVVITNRPEVALKLRSG